jgi:hypothetical protein
MAASQTQPGKRAARAIVIFLRRGDKSHAARLYDERTIARAADVECGGLPPL